MGISGISIPSLLLILLIVVLLFGTKKLSGLGSDLGSAIKGFKNSVKDEDKAADNLENQADGSSQSKVKTEEKQDA